MLLVGCGSAPTGAPEPTRREPLAQDAPKANPSMAKSAPTRVRISAIGVDSTVMQLGLKDDGSLETPPGAFPAGWYKNSPTPGEVGPSVLTGHVRYIKPGVFARLGELDRGDKISVTRKDHSVASFTITKVAQYKKSNFPTKAVYGNLDHAGLRLITCAGLDKDRKEFDDNLVVFARLDSSTR